MTSFNKGPGGDDLFHENASSMKEADADANRQLSGCETSSETNARKSTSSTKTISFPAPLPEFSAIMKKHMDAGSLLHHSNAFVQECGCFLLEIKPRPTSADYSNYSLTIVNRYQEFRDHSGKPEVSIDS